MRQIKKALVSVTDKSKLEELVAGLAEVNPEIEIISTGGTFRKIKEFADKYNVKLIEVSDFTGVPESPDDLVKTLNHKVAGALLMDKDNPEHSKWIQEQVIDSVDMAVVNLYPLEQKLAENPDISIKELMKFRDIGGPTMISATGKASDRYDDGPLIVVDHNDYGMIVEKLKTNKLDEETKLYLTAKAEAQVAAHIAASANLHFARLAQLRGTLPDTIIKVFERVPVELRYGENPQQELAGIYKERGVKGGLPEAEILQEGKEMSFNNYYDGDAAVKTAIDILNVVKDSYVAITVKHNNSCGAATGSSLEEALQKSIEGDPISAFGGIIAANKEITEKEAKYLAEDLKKIVMNGFIELLIAPSYTTEALEILKKKKSLRILKAEFVDANQDALMYKPINGGALFTTKDNRLYREGEVKVVAGDAEYFSKNKKLVEFGLATCKDLKSNSIVVVREYKAQDGSAQYQLLGGGAGQMNRRNSVRLACDKAKGTLEEEFTIKNPFRESLYYEEEDYEKDKREYVSAEMAKAVLVSDAFFPHPDGIDYANFFGIKNIVHPGGSIKDDDVIAAAEKYKMNMVMAGKYSRHFNH